jgi:hypothetical protein
MDDDDDLFGLNALDVEPAKIPSGKVRSGRARMERLTPEQRKELARSGAKARWDASKSAASLPNDSNNLAVIVAPKSADPRQGKLDLGIAKQIEIDGIGMGVLSDGTPFLTGRGLARLCGVAHAQIQRLSADWIEDSSKSRILAIKDLLLQRGVKLDSPYLAIEQRSGTFYAYPDVVCLAVLEYYAFDAAEPQPEAKKNFRLLAGKALRDFIYTQVGYDPNYTIPNAWRQFHDRVSLTYNALPRGYFGIFKEMADMIVTLGQAGMQIDSKFVPDISVGRHWAKHWEVTGIEGRYGARVQFEHNYPNYFSQARSNPQDCWCYPDAALGEFRRWLRDDYIGQGKFAKYITDKVRHQELPASFAQLAIAAYGGQQEDTDL